MGEEGTWNNRDMMTLTTNLSLDINKHPTDLSETSYCEEEASVELNLGLSLGGRFGVDKTPRKLKRSSSVLGTVPFAAEPENYAVGLARTTSLPAEVEEEWRKRKEMQSARRVDAKKRRCEKQSFGGGDDQTSSFESEGWVNASKSGFLQRHLVSCVESDGARGGSSSSLSELDNKNHHQQGSSNSCGAETSPKIMTRCSSNNSESHQGTEKPRADDKVNEKVEDDRKGKGTGTTSTGLFDMPCVFTKGDGPNGRRVDGILYKYGKVGEEVRIMCICHGSFLTPAEFVKHGGGGDVDRPLRHIVVNTSPSTF
ncbi:ninja-family protein AFP2 [Raphanus sativus]|uniref:Ninja-family protein n=1 Tax=Raphanus sativus TaxID=3726 RepID=A0A6J0MDN6_RAPSA|nr:ninja-family protein AFP2 [Raphanus sativus]XP_018470113.2 ninja-family protein AFP2 [Raphanus sativus]